MNWTRLLRIFTFLVIFLLVVSFILMKCAGESHWLLILLAYIPHIFFALPPLLLLVLALSTRNFREAGLNAAMVLLVLFLFMHPSFTITSTGTPESALKLVVLTYNIHAGTAGASKVADVLKGSGTDLVFLQEARQTERHTHPDPVPVIEEAFAGWHMVRGGEKGELLTVSREELENAREIPLGGYRKCLACDMKFHGMPIRLINVHFSTAGDGESLVRSGTRFREYLEKMAMVRRSQARALMELVQEEKSPCIVAGDFNSPPGTSVHRIMKSRFCDSFEKAGLGFGFTYSSGRPLWRIDYIFTDKSFTVGSCAPLRSRVSDHRPLRVELIPERVGER